MSEKLGLQRIIWQDINSNTINLLAITNDMTESEFLQYSENLFSYIEDAIDAGSWDLDTEISGNVLTIETDSGEKIIINRHMPNQELWIAAKSGGYHFVYRQNQWLSTRDGSEFFSILSQILSTAYGEEIQLTAFR